MQMKPRSIQIVAVYRVPAYSCTRYDFCTAHRKHVALTRGARDNEALLDRISSRVAQDPREREK